jgi:hypothetical protein
MKEFQWLLYQPLVTVYVNEKGQLVWKWEFRVQEKKHV